MQQVTADVAYNLGHGQCRLNYSSATQVIVSPFNGNLIQVAGRLYQIPSAGVTGSNSGLSASTLYYVYLYSNSGTLTIDFSTTAPATDTTAGNVGVQIMTGNNSYSLVGMVYTNASAQFVQNLGAAVTPYIGVLSYFNRRTLCAWNASGGSYSTTSTGSYVELSTAWRITFLTWNDELVDCRASGYGYNNTTGQYANVAVGVDGGADSSVTSNYYAQGGGTLAMFAEAVFNLSQGNHYSTIYGLVSADTGLYVMQAFVTVRG